MAHSQDDGSGDQITVERLAAVYEQLVRAWTGNKRARIGTKAYPWITQIALTEDPIMVALAVVFNHASASLDGCPTMDEDSLLKVCGVADVIQMSLRALQWL